jgi:hypothetical protein
MWNVKCVIVSVVTGATGIVSKGLKESLEVIPGKHLIDSLQTTVTLGTSHIVWEVLRSETWSLSGGDHRSFKRRSSRKKRPVTRDNGGDIPLIIGATGSISKSLRKYLSNT